MAHPVGSVSLLEQLTGLREAFYSLDCWFIRKDRSLGRARWETAQSRVRQRVPGFPVLPGTGLPSSPRAHQPGGSQNPVLWVFMEASLPGHD